MKLLAIAIVLAPLVARADDVDRPTNPDALDRYWKALEKLDAGDRLGALTDLRTGYELQRWPTFLYLIGKVAAAGNDCDTARKSITDFIAADPASKHRSNADAIVAKCNDEDRKREAARLAEEERRRKEALAAAEVVARKQPVRKTIYTPWYSDVLGDSLVGAGAIGLGIGAGFYLSSRSALDDAKSADDLASFHAATDRANSRRLTSQIAGGIGAALVLGGILRYAVRNDHYEVIVTPTGTVGVASWF